MKKSTYMTVAEMRANPERVEPTMSGKGGTRFEESTAPDIALEYFPKEGAVLECGPIFGAFTEYLQNNGFADVHVLDFVNLLRFPDQVKLTYHDIDFNMEPMPYSDSFFGGVAAWGIGEHLENPFHFVREVHRVLKPGGSFLFSLPNVNHIVSRLVFLKAGMFPRWNESNNHISILPRGVFDKTVLRYFDLAATRYIRPRVDLPFFRRFSYPANQWFGNYVVYVLRARK